MELDIDDTATANWEEDTTGDIPRQNGHGSFSGRLAKPAWIAYRRELLRSLPAKRNRPSSCVLSYPFSLFC